MNKEDKIIELLNENVDASIDLKENYHMIKSKINYDMNQKPIKKNNWIKALALSLSVIVIVLIAIPVVFNTFGAKKAFAPSKDTFNKDESANSSEHYDDESGAVPQDNAYLYFIETVTSVQFEKVYVRMGNIENKDTLEAIFNKLNIDQEVLEEYNSYALVLGKKMDKEVLSYTNGNKVTDIKLNLDYKIEDIYNQLQAQTNNTMEAMYIRVENNQLVYYTYYNNQEIKVIK